MDCQTVERENIPERYLNGTLDAKLKEAWELHYFTCDHCAEQLAVWQAIDQPLRSMEASIRQEIRPRKRLRVWIWAGVATAAALLAGLAVKTNRNSGLRPVPSEAVQKAPAARDYSQLARFDPPGYQAPTFRATGSPAEVQFHKAMERYTHQDYPAAISGLRAALKLDPKAAAPRFFLGACQLLTGNSAEAVAELSPVAAGDSPFASEASLALAKAYLLQSDKDQAVEVLRRLKDTPGEQREAAAKLLSQLTVQ